MDDPYSELAKEVGDKEPQLTSEDPNERKLARKLRIDRRLEAMRKLNLLEGEEEEIILEKTLLQQQLQKSTELLEKLAIESKENITNVRVANDSREVDRREEEGLGREKVIAALEEEAATSVQMFNTISDKWAAVLKYKDPLQISDDILAQKEKCDKLIRQKDGLMAMLRFEIRSAEIKFAKDQRKQNDDIEILSKRIENHVTLMRCAYRKELQLIEDVIETERKMLTEVNDKCWEEVYKLRDQEQESNSEKKFALLEEFEEICTNLRIDNQEKYRSTKIQLENDVETLQQELENIKALILLNTEKLDYNYQVLKKREDENIIIRSQQKRKMNKLQDNINLLRNKTCTYEEDSGNRIIDLRNEIDKLQKSLLAVEVKADHFAKLNDDMYSQIWDLNYKKAKGFLDRILMTDRILYEQQLGLPWLQPEQQLLDKRELPSFQIGIGGTTETEMRSMKSIRAMMPKENLGQLFPKGETMAHRRILRQVLCLIADRCGFLLESRLNDILAPYLECEQTLIKVDTVFMAMAIKRKEEIDILFEYFLPYTHCPICRGGMPFVDDTTFSETVSNVSPYEPPIEQPVDFTVDADIHEETIDESNDSSPTLSEDTDILTAVCQPVDVIEDILTDIMDTTQVDSLRAMPSFFNKSLLTTPSSKEEDHYEPDDSKANAKQGSASETQSTVSVKMFCHKKHPLVISPVYTYKALKIFVSKFYVPKEGVITLTQRLSHQQNTVSRAMRCDEVKMFWERFRTVFSAGKEELWNGLMFGLHKYHEILKDRRKLHEELLNLRKQNADLEFILWSYKKDDKKLLKPPCAVNREIPIYPCKMQEYFSG